MVKPSIARRICLHRLNADANVAPSNSLRKILRLTGRYGYVRYFILTWVALFLLNVLLIFLRKKSLVSKDVDAICVLTDRKLVSPLYQFMDSA